MLFETPKYSLLLCVALLLLNQTDVLYARSIFKARSVLVFSPHPDDDVLGCGGMLIKHVKRGARVTIVYLTCGESSHSQGYTRDELRIVRQREAREAAKVLGVHDLLFLHLPDRGLKADEETCELVKDIIQRKAPQVLYVPHEYDGHMDHAAGHMIVKGAVEHMRRQGYSGLPRILCYEVWTPLSRVDYAVNVSDHMKTKLRALKKHESQLAVVDYVSAIEGLNRYRGISLSKGKYVECFCYLKV